MDIKLKYSLHQKVYILWNKRICPGEIDEIIITDKIVKYQVKTLLTQGNHYIILPEWVVFTTPAELFKNEFQRMIDNFPKTIQNFDSFKEEIENTPFPSGGEAVTNNGCAQPNDAPNPELKAMEEIASRNSKENKKTEGLSGLLIFLITH
jgi:hypothetical protein